jgi:hypothetical protein
VALQAAISLVFLVLATLLTRSAVEAGRVDLGFDAGRLLVVSADRTRSGGGQAAGGVDWPRALAAVQDVTGVEQAAVVLHPPFSGDSRVFLDRPGGRVRFYSNRTSASYFETIDARLVRDRTYTASEVSAGAQVAVISAALGRRYWPGSDPVGDTLGRVDDSLRRWSVIGIVDDMMTERVDASAAETVYRPLAASDWREAHLLVRASRSASQIAAPVTAALRSVEVPVRADLTVVSDALAQELEQPRLLAALSTVLALVSVCLATMGLYGVAALAIGSRRREIAVRVAFGATSRALARTLVVDTLKPVAVGLAARLFVAISSSQLLSSALYGVGPRDPLSILGATALLLGAALLAVAPAVWRATRLNPSEELKES